jgi:tetratricopeptide (TPR) repeat protein
LGDIEFGMKKYRKAIKTYDRALALDSELPRALLHRAISLAMIEDWKEAVKSAEAATKLVPEDAGAWRTLGDVNLRAGKHKAAMKALKKASEIDPEDASTRNTMGMIAYRDGKLKEAVKHFRAALIRDKNHISALRNLGFTYMEQEDWAEAAKIWDRLEKLIKNDPDLYDVQATNYARLDDFCGASEAWEKARKLYKKKGKKKDAARVTELGRAARINCGRQKKAARAEREHEKATRRRR